MKKERCYGIDLLRMLSMFMIVCLHVLSQGGVMVRLLSFPEPYYACWLLESACFCAVNIYGLISGYVGVTGSHRLSRIIILWLQTMFYTVGITAVLGFFHP